VDENVAAERSSAGNDSRDHTAGATMTSLHRSSRSNGILFTTFIIALLAAASQTFAAERPARLKVSENQRFLVTQDGKPFFYLGDTAWELFHRATREDADIYLKNRAARGFTVIQAVVLAELDGLHTPNAYGQTPLKDDDPSQQNEEYFRHVDWIVNRAGELGIYIGMLPTWGDKWNRGRGAGPEIFTPENSLPRKAELR
jgi:hypothetical protein